MTVKTVLISGANKGIGLNLAKQFKAKNYRVLGTARKPDQADELKQVADAVYQLDVTSEQSIKQLAADLQKNETVLDLLVNNAGVYERFDLAELNYDGMVREFKTNSLGPLFLTLQLRPLLQKSHQPRIVCISSSMGSIKENTSGGSYGYRASKSALNSIFKSWSIDLPELPVLLVHPGYIQTSMTGGKGQMSAEECAAKLSQLFDKFEAGQYHSGQFIHRDGHELPW